MTFDISSWFQSLGTGSEGEEEGGKEGRDDGESVEGPDQAKSRHPAVLFAGRAHGLPYSPAIHAGICQDIPAQNHNWTCWGATPDQARHGGAPVGKQKRPSRDPSPKTSIKRPSSGPPSQNPCLKTTPIRPGAPDLSGPPAPPQARLKTHSSPPPHQRFHPSCLSRALPSVSPTFPHQPQDFVGPYNRLSVIRIRSPGC
jgi:hypothetical protein